MSDSRIGSPLLPACREILDAHPESLHIRETVEVLEKAIPDRPGVAVSHCRAIIETTCKTILTDRNVPFETIWDASKLVSKTLKHLPLGSKEHGMKGDKLRTGVDSLVRGVNQIVQGVAQIRNDYGSAAHGADAYAPLLDSRYVEIVVRATDAVVGLLFKTHVSFAQQDSLERFRYGDYRDFDEFIDAEFGPFEVLEIPLIASEALFQTDFRGYRTALVQFLQEMAEAGSAGEEE